jgi:hypothetical protein
MKVTLTSDRLLNALADPTPCPVQGAIDARETLKVTLVGQAPLEKSIAACLFRGQPPWDEVEAWFGRLSAYVHR